MKCSDFDRRFAAYLESWTNENRDKYANMNEVEAQVPEVYMEWLNTPADWLGGTAPGDYFKPLSDPEALVKWMLEQETIEVVKHYDLLADFPEVVTFIIEYVQQTGGNNLVDAFVPVDATIAVVARELVIGGVRTNPGSRLEKRAAARRRLAGFRPHQMAQILYGM